ncbi:MAG: hypothetical protein RL335_921 [Bacteroidota bacterium]|jgi:hypothetical protein
MPYLARISYNNKGWIYPSSHGDMFSGEINPKCNFRFEEWFFNERRFIGLNDKVNCHFAYLEPLRHFDAQLNKIDSIIIYSLRYTNTAIERYVIAELETDEFRLIGIEEYSQLIKLNKFLIREMIEELYHSIPTLQTGIIIKHINQHVDEIVKNSLFPSPHRLWNIEILKKNIRPLMERITPDTDGVRSFINHLDTYDLWHISPSLMYSIKSKS